MMEIYEDQTHDFFNILKNTQPKLLKIVIALLKAGQPLEVVVKKVEQISGKNSTLPGLVQEAGKYIIENLI